ncbi:MAG: hypothetical protein PHC92_03565 [Syntrophomonadaceae bacterium]|nr:hypothetical protein [Syntrophomonadaceae bacterium]MDD3022828.1 hypothetical protein [Syntrophomonadaceae bacterium]
MLNTKKEQLEKTAVKQETKNSVTLIRPNSANTVQTNQDPCRWFL